jgi:hypothetical protein
VPPPCQTLSLAPIFRAAKPPSLLAADSAQTLPPTEAPVATTRYGRKFRLDRKQDAGGASRAPAGAA